ncbi:MAG: GGDEF domain-containing protein [Pelomonas sp.]|nr:GGDEF domain-containing protein [Roseateles sp.]
MGSMRRRMVMVAGLVSLGLVAFFETVHFHDEGVSAAAGATVWLGWLARDIVVFAVVAFALLLVLDRFVLEPLRRLAADSEAFDPTYPPPESRFGDAPSQPAELRQISASITRVHESLWRQLRNEQGKAEALRAEVQRQQEALRRAEAALEAKNRELGSLSRVDLLTGLANRRDFDEALRREFKRAQRQRGLLALAVLDLDHFKKFNELYGAAAGDAVLQRFGQLLASHFKRDTDHVARLGGEEFVALLPDFGLAEAQARLEQLREDFRGFGFAHAAGVDAAKVLTVSIGLTALSPAHPFLSPQALMQAADEALYIAKHAGRDRLSMSAQH